MTENVRKEKKMAKYTGSKCICCERRFSEGDDIVVCPDCGTPYHRDCYIEKGSCINTALHEKGIGWLPDPPETPPPMTIVSPGVKRCIRCGAENPPELRYCEQCGTPLINMESPIPFNDLRSGNGMQDQNGGRRIDVQMEGDDQPNMNGSMREMGFTPVMLDQDSDIDGVKLGDLARYVGTNPIGFLPSFIKFAKTGRKLSLNIFAFLFTPVYFMYRKMMGWGIVAAAVMALLGVPSMIYTLQSGDLNYTIDLGINMQSKSFALFSEAVLFLNLGLKCLAGLFANYLYYKQARRDIGRIRKNPEDKSSDDLNREIIITGGASIGYMILGYMVYTIVTFGAVLLISRLV